MVVEVVDDEVRGGVAASRATILCVRLSSLVSMLTRELSTPRPANSATMGGSGELSCFLTQLTVESTWF